MSGMAAGASLSGQTAGAPVLAIEDNDPPKAIKSESGQIRWLLQEVDATPMESVRAKTLIARDMGNDPLPLGTVSAPGRTRVDLASQPLQFAVRLAVPGFGEVYCYADGLGKGYSAPGTKNFVVEAAMTRLHRVRAAVPKASQLGVPIDPSVSRDLEAASVVLSQKSGSEQTAAAYASLARSLRAGEKLTLDIAKYRITKLPGPRTDFLFGGLASGWQRGAAFEKPFTQLFNYGVVSWYSWSQNAAPEAQRINYSRMDQSVDWCLQRKIVPKGFGYIYLTRGATPEWFRSWPFDRAAAEYERIVRQTARRYDGRIPVVEVINEAHDKANLFRFTKAQVLDLTRRGCLAAREGSTTVKRLINHCCLWAEYGRRANSDGAPRWSPYTYLKDCFANGVECERIGLQLYYPQHDLFEIDRMLQRFSDFGKPLQISELSCNSAPGLDAASMRPKSMVPGWHGPWTETMQADWLEAIYTLCYSKSFFDAVGYWDLADIGGHFWPHGGLLRADYSPKQSFHRLLALKKSWGF
jgi:endo-1,4-beta-xylanase